MMIRPGVSLQKMARLLAEIISEQARVQGPPRRRRGPGMKMNLRNTQSHLEASHFKTFFLKEPSKNNNCLKVFISCHIRFCTKGFTCSHSFCRTCRTSNAGPDGAKENG